MSAAATSSLSNPLPSLRKGRCQIFKTLSVRRTSADICNGTNPRQWSMVEKTAKSEIQERKIRVVFLSQEGSQRTGEALTPGGARNINGAVRRAPLRGQLGLTCPTV